MASDEIVAYSALDAEQQLAAAEARFHAIVDRSSDGMMVLRHDGRICFVNPAMEKLLGRTSDELIGEMFGVPVLPGKVTEIGVLQRGGPTRVAEMRVVNTEWNYEPAYLATLRDVTERRRAEEESREAVRRRDQFLAMLSHELRNPLAAIVNATRIIRRQGVNERTLSQAQDIIERQGHQMTRLLDDLLDVSRVSQGKIQLRRQQVDVIEVIEDAARVVGPLLHQRRLELCRRLPDVPIWVDADMARLQQVIVNLLTNAAKYSECGGKIFVRATVDGDAMCQIEVADTGVGIPAEMLESLFEPFVQGPVTLARSEGGLGLGLSLVRMLAQLHGGKVTAASPGVGEGSTFTVRWPLASGHTARVAAERPSPANDGSTSRRIVVVEDNTDVREMLKTVLELDGHEIETAEDGLQAIELIEFQHPDVALVDIGLPGIDGYEVAKHLRSRPSNDETLLIALTGYGQPEDQQRALQAGFDAHLVKPVDLEQLTNLLARSRRQQSQVVYLRLPESR